MDLRRRTILRFIPIFIGITLGFLAVIGQIVKLQRVEKDFWLKIAKRQEAVEQPIKPLRGNIYDCEGRLLASSLPRYALIWDMRTQALHTGGDSAFYNNIDSISRGLARIMDNKTADEYKRELTAAFKNRTKRVKIGSRNVSFIEKKQIMQLPLLNRSQYQSGLIVEESNQRVKPFGSLASRTIGNIDGDKGIGYVGLEKQFNEALSGTPGLCQRQRIAGKNEIRVIQPAENGCDLVTTIDANLQDIVEHILRKKLEEGHGKWGCCILMEVQTGEIKAISNLDRSEDGLSYYEKANHAVTRVDPGSTFKTIALMACLDDGKVDYNTDKYLVFDHKWYYNSLPHQDSHLYGRDSLLSVQQALAQSSNIALAKMVTESYDGSAAKFVNKLTEMGVRDTVYCEIPGAQAPNIPVPNDIATISKMAYGYSVELSPMQTLTFYNGIANGGKMIRPFIVKEIRKDSSVIQTFSTSTIREHMCNDQTLADVRDALHAVVWTRGGTAGLPLFRTERNKHIKRAQSDLVHIAGKTGTSQLFTRESGYTDARHRISFVGYFPEENPQYTCICVIEEPDREHSAAGTECGTAVRLIAEQTMALRGTIESNKIEHDYTDITKPAIKGGTQHKVLTATNGSGLRIESSDDEWVKVKDMQVVATDVLYSQVPNVVGMGARDAMFAIEQTGMKARVVGQGKVIRQSVKAGTKPVVGAVVVLELK